MTDDVRTPCSCATCRAAFAVGDALVFALAGAVASFGLDDTDDRIAVPAAVALALASTLATSALDADELRAVAASAADRAIAWRADPAALAACHAVHARGELLFACHAAGVPAPERGRGGKA